jgi:predicted ATPase
VKYLYSYVDRGNFNWFTNDMTVASLSKMALRTGFLRGLSNFEITFTYPISVIAGANRSGKSTILAMAACAFHNYHDGFKLPERNIPYYRFSDFFIQSSEEIPPGGIYIGYQILNNNWRKSKDLPDGIGPGWQARIKREKGKWNKYSRRVKRNVVFFGVQRVVPPSEKSVSKSYRSYFSEQAPAGWENQVKEVVGRILGTVYDDFRMKTYRKYRLPVVSAQGITYSGFNMGAGENALFEIFSTIYATPRGTLLIIDEIELGLHENAQKRLIDELKKVCLDRHIQVICTTHSPAILEAVPPEARFYIDSFSGKTVVTPGISSLYAAGKLAGKKTNELDIYVEDIISAALIESFITSEVRKRVNIVPIGSPVTIIHQMAARYKDPKSSECIAVMDGDQASTIDLHRRHFVEALESSKDHDKETKWFTQRFAFLPGTTWPEKWLIQSLQPTDINELASVLGVPKEELSSYLDEAVGAAEHNELYILAGRLSLDPMYIFRTAACCLARSNNDDFHLICTTIERFLSGHIST